MKNLFDNKPVKYVTILVACLVIPIVIKMIIQNSSLSETAKDSWIGFWGSYLGAILGVIGTFFAISVQLDAEKSSRQSEKIDNTFFNLLNYHNNSLENVDGSKLYSGLKIKIERERQKYFNAELSGYKSMLKRECSKIKERSAIKSLGEAIMVEHSNIQRKDIQDLINYGNLDGTVLEFAEESYMKPILEATKIEREIISALPNLNIKEELILEVVENIHKFYECIEEDPSEDFREGYEKVVSLNNLGYKIIPFDKRNEIIKSFFSRKNEFCTYFQLFSTIIDFLNRNNLETDAKSTYIKILKSTLGEEILILIHYYSHYDTNNESLLKQLNSAKFFEIQPNMNISKIFW